MTDRPLVVILGAGRPFTGTEPSALMQTSGNRRVLDWLLEAFEQSLTNPEIHFVGGYRLEEIVEAYPEIHFSRNEQWEESGPVESLFTAPIRTDRPVYVCYADTIFEAGVVDELNGDSDVSIAVDRNWQTRYQSRSEESLERAEKVVIDDGLMQTADTSLSVGESDAEFTGLLRLNPEAIERSKALWESRTIGRQADIPKLLRALGATGMSIETIDIDGNWAELETADDLSRFVLDTKANTLRRLRSMVEESVVLRQYSFTVEEWQSNSTNICRAIEDRFDGDTVIIRSSALSEDSWEESNAGRFESVLDIPSTDHVSLSESIERVIDSYPDEEPANQVLVQPMIDAPDQSGVVMTRSLDGGSPYYVINYDATTSSTESVTDGTGKHLKTAIVRKDIVDREGLSLSLKPIEAEEQSSQSLSEQYPTDLSLVPLLRSINELEELVGYDSLDVEFAIGKDETVYILQTRPMTLDPAENSVEDQTVFETVESARREFGDAQSPSPTVVGDRTVFGVMPDWNPAEIIGRQPRRLAASLYRELIMNETWARQRAEYGYRDVRPHPLMKQFAGQPYVDVRADFNSFIPASVPDELAERLVEYYLERLEDAPELHDKVEFDIVLTCLPFDYDEQIEPLLDAGFTKKELEPLREGLQEITRNAFDRIDDDLAAIDKLQDRYNAVIESDLPPLRGIQHLLTDCRRFGTLPFAHLARTAFVATTLLRSLERKGILTTKERSAFQNSLNTIAREFERDAYCVSTGDFEWDMFVQKYGHLRPGTYEITSPSYSQMPEEYLQPIVETATSPEEHPDPKDVWSAETKQAIEGELEQIGLPADANQFIEFLVDAIEGREHSKFVFSRNLSEALERIASFGNSHGFSREDLSHVPIEIFFEMSHDHPPADIESWLEKHVRAGRERHTITEAVELPPLLFDETDFMVFERPTREPNFVTSKTVTETVVQLDDEDTELADVEGKIVIIPQADPGYDWLFGRDIAGLITMYGGANSHMAVRAAEFSLPAAIGVGENKYQQLSRADVLELNCSARDIREVQ